MGSEVWPRRRAQRVDPIGFVMTGSVIASLTLIVVLALWSSKQVGGLNQPLLNQFLVLATPLALVAFGTTVVLLTGGFDLSAAGVVSVVNTIAATTLADRSAIIVCIALLALSAGIGAINGLLVVKIRLSSLAASLAVYIVLAGLALIILPVPGGGLPAGFVDAFTGPAIGGWTRAVVVLIVLGGGWRALARSRFGTRLRAIGGDAEAARLSGVPVARTTVQAYALAGVFYGLGGLYITAVTSSGDPRAGEPFLLASFAAVALGGSSFAGGQGSAVASVVGALTLTAIPKALFVFGAADYLAGVFQGVVVIIAVIAGLAAANLRRRREIARRGTVGGTP